MNPPPALFTAAQLAAALGVTPQAAKARLVKCPPCGDVIVRGQKAKAWAWNGLPGSMRSGLEEAMQERGCKSVENLLANPPVRWDPPVQFTQLPAIVQDRALKLRDALALVMERQHSTSGPELIELAHTRYRQHLHTEAPNQARLRYLVDRATRRDNGFGDWMRPELYLEDADFCLAAQESSSVVQFARFDAIVSTLPNSAEISVADRAHLVHALFKDYQAAGGDTQTRAQKRGYVEHLLRAVPTFYRPESGVANESPARALNAIRRLFNRRYAEWMAQGCSIDAVADRRKGKVGRKGHICPECEKKIHDLAAHLRGRRSKHGVVSMAFRLLRMKGQLCSACMDHWSFNPRKNKSRMAGTLRDRVTPNRLTIAKAKGTKVLRLAGPHIERDWSDTHPGDWFSIDDMTTNEYAWDEVTVDGVKQAIWGPVQMLALHDPSISYWLDYLMYFGAPNGRYIRRAFHQVFVAGVGLPRTGLLLERGVFASRYVVGERDGKDWFHFRETEAGLERFLHYGVHEDEPRPEQGLRDPALGLKIRHATTPGAKPIESDFNPLQVRSSLLPGFAGFNQRQDEREDFQALKRRVETKQIHPQEAGWLHIRDLAANYRAIMEESNREPKNGKRHRGATPLELWSEYVSTHPLTKLPQEMRYILATQCKTIRIRENGIKVPLCSYEDAWYRNDDVARLFAQGVREVTAYVNLDDPSMLTVEHKGQRFFPTRHLLPAMTATKEQLSAEMKSRREYVRQAAGHFGSLTHPLQNTIIRDSNYSDADKARGAEIQEQTEAHKADQAAAQRKLTQARQAAAVLGGAMPSNPRNIERVRDGIAMEREALEELAMEARRDQAPKTDTQS